jgi:hypothetical protein
MIERLIPSYVHVGHIYTMMKDSDGPRDYGNINMLNDRNVPASLTRVGRQLPFINYIPAFLKNVYMGMQPKPVSPARGPFFWPGPSMARPGG